VEKENGNIKKLRNRICVGYNERTSAGNAECSSICLHSIILMSDISKEEQWMKININRKIMSYMEKDCFKKSQN
jgi:hypothetical protein